jgi:hypothetical protein
MRSPHRSPNFCRLRVPLTAATIAAVGRGATTQKGMGMTVGIRSRVLPKFDRGLKLGVATIAVLICSAGTASAAGLDTSSLDFGNQNIGTTSATKTIHLGVSGYFCVPIPGGPCFPEFIDPVVSVTGPFTQTNDCPSPLSAESWCTIVVQFAPTAAGPQTGTLSVADTGPINEPIPGVDLRGTGVDPKPTQPTQPTIIDQPTVPQHKCRKANGRASASKRKCHRHHGHHHH